MAKKHGWEASQEARSKKARLREIGMFNDIGVFVMEWRLNGGSSKYPPEAQIRDYLNKRGWVAERGGKVTIRTVQEMIRHMDPELDALPTAGEERLAQNDGEILPGTETLYVGYSPQFWMEYRNAVLNGWRPKCRNIGDDDESSNDSSNSDRKT